jgi:hypothetical protein
VRAWNPRYAEYPGFETERTQELKIPAKGARKPSEDEQDGSFGDEPADFFVSTRANGGGMVRGEIPRQRVPHCPGMKQTPLFAGVLADSTSAADSRAAQPGSVCS